MAIKNFWSLNVDEAVTADAIARKLGKKYQIFFPTNSQLPYIDLIVYNMNNHKSATIQVKASKPYSWKDKEDYSYQSVRSDRINPKIIDFFIFVYYHQKSTKDERKIFPRFVVVPTDKLLKIVGKDKRLIKDGTYRFSFNLWKDPKNGKEYLGDYGINKSHIDNDNNGIDFTRFSQKFELIQRKL